jgi:hypothetical protein
MAVCQLHAADRWPRVILVEEKIDGQAVGVFFPSLADMIMVRS